MIYQANSDVYRITEDGGEVFLFKVNEGYEKRSLGHAGVRNINISLDKLYAEYENAKDTEIFIMSNVNYQPRKFQRNTFVIRSSEQLKEPEINEYSLNEQSEDETGYSDEGYLIEEEKLPML